MERKTQEKKKRTKSKRSPSSLKCPIKGVNAIEIPAGQKRRQLKNLKPNLPSIIKADYVSTQLITCPQAKNCHPMPPKREKGTLTLDPDLREKGARREGKHTS